MERYICIHGHFYQPPRENPWLEAIEIQDTAYPYHDWNERITAECYEPNALARILDDDGWIVRIVNNYSRISFNVGPTLLSWMQEKTPDVYFAILEADRRSMERFSGHGSAMAQGWGHVILPLSNERDRRTQVLWGVRDFEHRFGRKPEGMWLPETAVNTDTLETLVDYGIRFTVLAPRQAARICPIGGDSGDANSGGDGGDANNGGDGDESSGDENGTDSQWEEVGERIDPTRAYQCVLPSGRTIALFFYDGPISQAVAFERLLERGEYLAGRLIGAISGERKWPQLIHIATDGETYGHHHRHGEMALAWALDEIERTEDVRLTNYGEYLEKHPPTHQVEIAEDTSWSCYHGVERWRSNCGCSTGGNPGWTQEWRKPLRDALDWLRSALDPAYEKHAGRLLKDPWQARDAYIDVILDRSRESIDRFLDEHAREPLSEDDRVLALKLLEMQRHAMLMYTSCGWFFDELSGIETSQVIFYAGRAIQIAEEALDERVEEEFLRRLEQAKSNIPARRDGRKIYDDFVKPAFVDLENVGAHYAISSLFEEFEDRARVFCYDIDALDLRRRSAGRAQLRIGRARVTSGITLRSDVLAFAALHLGDHVMNGGVRLRVSDEEYNQIVQATEETFDRGEFTEVLRLMGEIFGESNYTLRALFRDEQHKVMRLVLAPTLAGLDETYRQIYEQHAAMIRFLAGVSLPIPRRLATPATFVLNAAFRAAAEADPPDVERMRAHLEEASQVGVALDHLTLSWVLEHALERVSQSLTHQPHDVERISLMDHVSRIVHEVPFEVNLAPTQNTYYTLMQEVRPQVQQAARSGDSDAQRWLSAFDALGEQLRVRVQ